MKYQKGFTVVEVVFFALIIAGATGWVWNIVKIVNSDFAQITGILIMRCVGVFIAPLGAVLGFI